VDERIDAGAALPVERARVEVALSSARLEHTRVAHELAASRRALAASWGDREPSFSAVRGDLTEIAPPAPLADLEAQLSDNPDLARWSSELDLRRANLALERARGVPNPTLSLGGRHFADNGDLALVLKVSLPLPVFDRNQGSVLAARREIAKAKAERTSIELTTRTALALRYEDLTSAYEQASLLRTQTLPMAQSTFESVRDGYRQGRIRHHEVLDANRTLFELRARYIETLAAYHQARTDIERLTGRSLASPAGAEDVR
jgi:cobalt-zinc-cadmium efflux system outer membrane protein